MQYNEQFNAKSMQWNDQFDGNMQVTWLIHRIPVYMV